jgi:hypothetical protein
MLNLFTLMPGLGPIYNLSKKLLKDHQQNLIRKLKLSKLLVLINLKFSTFLFFLLIKSYLYFFFKSYIILY